MGKGRNYLSDQAVSDLRKIKRKVLGTGLNSGEYGGAAQNPNPTWYWAKVAATPITAGSLASPTTFTFNIWLPDPSSSSDPVPFIVATDSRFLGVTGVNRSVGTASTGTMIKVEYAFGEWSPKWEDC